MPSKCWLSLSCTSSNRSWELSWLLLSSRVVLLASSSDIASTGSCFTRAGLQGRPSNGCCGASRRFPHQISRCVGAGGPSLPASFISRGRAPQGCPSSGCCDEGRLLKFPDQIPLSVWGGGISSGTAWAKECCAWEGVD
uniref:Putative secreted protein n=1 Tax=Ixodes ricinus TaxID=34613 RepID=A0A147BMG5_IXORI